MAAVDLPIPQRAPVDSGGCGSCALRSVAGLRKLGFEPGAHDFVVALAGNPNTGKSTVFNALTGLRQRAGNWTGTTVTRAEGSFRYGEHRYRLVDLPGTYSLQSTSTDEEVARDFLLFGEPDVTIVVVDATRLQRNLNLVLQILQISGRVVVALNLLDEADRHGITVDVRHLARELGVAVVPMTARRGSGVPELLGAVAQLAIGAEPPAPARTPSLPGRLEQAVAELADELCAAHPAMPNARWVALRLLEGDQSIEAALRNGTLGDVGRSGYGSTAAGSAAWSG